MVSVVAHVGTERGGLDLSSRGYQVLFRANECNRCPGCGRAQWYVGRITAECVFCGTALPLAEARWGERGGAWPHKQLPAVPEPEIRNVEAERHRQTRRPGEGRVVNVLLDGTPRAFTVSNYSATGAMIAAPGGLVAAKLVEVVAPSGEIVGAEVRWSGGEFVGLQFAKPLPLVLAPTNRLP